MFCSGCVNYLVRVRDGEREFLCVLDRQSVNQVTDCNLKTVPVVGLQGSVVQAEEEVEEEEVVVRKRGWPKGRPRKVGG